MAVRGTVRLIGAAAVAVLLAVGAAPVAGAQEEPAPAEPTAPAPLSIRDVLVGRSTQVTGSASGGFGGGDTLDIVLLLENETDAPIDVVVPRGSLFESENPGEQVAVAAGPVDEVAASVEHGVDPVITLDPGPNTVQLAGFCAQRLDSGPYAIVPMSWAGVAAEPLTTVLTNIAATDPSPEAAQHAVWWVTDVPVVPVPAEVDPLLDGVDTEAFAASPKRVTGDERYTPQWGRDQALDAEDPFGESPFSMGDPGDSGAFDVDGGSGGGPGVGLLILGAIFACFVVAAFAARAARRTPAVVRTGTVAGAAAPGWHPDPGQAGQLRYWNGSAWTNDTRPG